MTVLPRNGLDPMEVLFGINFFKGVKDNVVHIVNYFWNIHMPAAWYKAAGGEALVTSQDVQLTQWQTAWQAIPRSVI